MPCIDGSGDLFVSIPLPKNVDLPDELPNRWLIALGDMSGKGETASRLKDALATELIRLVGTTTEPASILKALNNDLFDPNKFACLLVALQLEEREPPETLYHGTVERFLPSILEEGLVRGKRHHVHLSKDVETARKVGARRGKPVILTVDAGRMHREGHKFLLSANGVWLTDAVPVGYLTKT
jgi:hypothetical protein